MSVFFAESVQHPLGPEEGRVTNNCVRNWPLGQRAVRVQQGVAVLDTAQLAQDRVLRCLESVAAHPLNFTNPDRHAGQFVRIPGSSGQ
nr:hypothetical protein [Roseinatronobacter monicus]